MQEIVRDLLTPKVLHVLMHHYLIDFEVSMILIGRYLSPFVRRVGTSLRWVELNYEHRSLSPSRDASEILKINPMGKVPILILDNGEQLIESSAILDTVLATVPGQTLLPGTGAARKRILQHTSIVTSA